MTADVMRLPALPPFDPTAIPDEAAVARHGRSLRLTWQDGTEAILEAATLRLRCRCAWCTRDRLESRFPDNFGEVSVTHIEPKGGYAVHIAFSDGHARGIYPWVYLRDLASMPTSANRAA